MTEEEFWDLLVATRKHSNGDFDRQQSLLITELSNLTAEQIISFDYVCMELKAKVFSHELWDAGYVLTYHTGENSYNEFVAWLMLQGKEVFYEAVSNPDSVASIDNTSILQLLERDYGIDIFSCSLEAYRLKTGSETIPNLKPPPIFKIKGVPRESREEAEAKFPKLAVKHRELVTLGIL
jgi:hypothetical protein